MIGLGIEEQAELDRAKYDGEGWRMSPDMAELLRERLATKGLIRLWKGNWQLTPIGYGATSRSKAMADNPTSSGIVSLGT